MLRRQDRRGLPLERRQVVLAHAQLVAAELAETLQNRALEAGRTRGVVVVDGRIAYTGSMNLVDPRFFKQDAGVGEWIDAMVRIAGPAIVMYAPPINGKMIPAMIAEINP